MLPSKCMLSVPLVGAAGFCVSAFCACGSKEYLRRRTRNRSSPQSERHYLHQNGGYGNLKSDSNLSLNHGELLQDQSRHKNLLPEELKDIDTREYKVQQSTDNHLSMNLGKPSPSEYDEEKPGSDHVDKSGVDNDGFTHPDSPIIQKRPEIKEEYVDVIGEHSNSNEEHKEFGGGSSENLFKMTDHSPKSMNDLSHHTHSLLEEWDKHGTREGREQQYDDDVTIHVGNPSPSEYDEEKQGSDHVDKGGVDNDGNTHSDSPIIQKRPDIEEEYVDDIGGPSDINEEHKEFGEGSSKDLSDMTNECTFGNRSRSEYDEEKPGSDHVDKGGYDNDGNTHSDSPRMKKRPDFDDSDIRYMDESSDSDQDHSNAHGPTEISESHIRHNSGDDSDKNSVKTESPYRPYSGEFNSNWRYTPDLNDVKSLFGDEHPDSYPKYNVESSSPDNEDSGESPNNFRIDLADGLFNWP